MRAAADSGRNPWQCERPFSRATSFRPAGGNAMKITGYEAIALKVPEDDPLANMPEEAGRTRPGGRPAAAHRQRHRGHRRHALRRKMTARLHTAVEELAALTVGEDPMRIEAIVAKLRANSGDARAGRHLHAGAVGDRHRAVGHQGQGAGPAAVEAAGRPSRSRRRPMPRARCAAASPTSRRSRRRETLLKKGFSEMKTQMALPGNPTPADEVRRVQAWSAT